MHILQDRETWLKQDKEQKSDKSFVLQKSC